MPRHDFTIPSHDVTIPPHDVTIPSQSTDWSDKRTAISPPQQIHIPGLWSPYWSLYQGEQSHLGGYETFYRRYVDNSWDYSDLC